MVNDLLFQIKNFIYETCLLAADFLKTINLIQLGIVVILAYVLVMRNWMFKRLLAFYSLLVLSLAVMVRIDYFLKMKMGQEAAHVPIQINHWIFLIFVVLLFFYYVAVKDQVQ